MNEVSLDTAHSGLLSSSPMARRIRFHDWSSTSLGPIEHWPVSFRTAVSLALNRSEPALIWWGAELHQVYNDAFCALAGLSPGYLRLGAPAREVWSSVWDDLREPLAAACGGGPGAGRVAVVPDTIRERGGLLRWSFSPIPDDAGGVGGVLVTLSDGTPHPAAMTFERANRVPGGPRDSLRGAGVLVVSGAASVRAELGGLLEGHGAAVSAVSRGSEALEALGGRVPDLVLVDAGLPDMGGRDLIAALRAEAAVADLPVILLAPDSLDGSSSEWANGADDYVLRPFVPSELVIRAEAALYFARLRRDSCVAVRRSEEHLRLVMDAIPAIVAYTDRDRRIRYFNQRFCEWTGLDRERIAGRTLGDIYGEEFFAQVRPWIDRALEGHFVRFEAEMPCRRGGSMPVEVKYVPDVRPDGHVAGYVTLVQDVSERRRTQHQLEELGDRLSQELEGMMALHQAGTSLVQEDDLKTLLVRVIEFAVAITGARKGDIRLLDESTGATQLGAQHGFGSEYTMVFETMRDEIRSWTETLGTGRRVIVGGDVPEPGIAVHGEVPDTLLSAGIQSLQSTPLMTRGGRLLGMFTTYYGDRKCPTERDQRLLDLLSRQASDLIERRRHEVALRASERRYAQLIESLPIGVYTCDVEGRIQMYNPAAVQMWGRAPGAEARWCGWGRMYTVDGSPIAPEESPMARTIREGRPANSEELIVEDARGERRWVHPYPVAIDDEQGRISGGVNMLLDVTERRRAEETRALLAAIVASSGDGIISMTLDGTITSWNASAERLFGYTEAEMVGENVGVLMPAETVEEQPRILEEVRQGRRVEDLETVRLTKDGRRLDVSLTVSPVWGESGEIIGASKIARDISARKRADAEIQRLNADLEARVNELQTLLDVAPVGVFIGQDPECEVVSMNRAGARMLRLPWPEGNASLTAPGAKPCWQYFRQGKAVPSETLPLQLCSRTGEEVVGELSKFVFDDGSVMHAKLSVSPLRDGAGQPRGCVATMVDITDQIENDVQLTTLNERLQHDIDDMVRLHEVSTHLVREQDLVVLLEAILDAAMSVTGAEKGTTELLDQETDELQLVAWRGFEEASAERFESISMPGEWADGDHGGKQRYVITDVDADPRTRSADVLEGFRAAGVRAMQSTPLVSRSGQLLGIFSTHWSAPHEPADRELQMLDLLARQAADAIERSHSDTVLRHLNATLEDRVRARTTELEQQRLQLRRLAAELTTAEQRERRRLAALLHDDLQQLLVSAKMTISGASRATKVEVMADACARTEALIQESIDAARDMSRQLRPPVLYEDGLLPALDWLAMDMERKHGLVVTVDTDDAIEPEDHDLRALLFESARELLLNVVKYAGVKEATVEAVSPDDGILQLSVSDPGRGFQLNALGGGAANEGFGLFSIRERLAAIGGSMSVETGLGEGTTVTIEAPLYVEEHRAEVTRPRPEPGRTPAKRVPKRTGRETRVLVVDDHAVVRQGIATLIEEMPGFVVVGEASDGFEAIELIAEHQPDVVLMDVNMPRMNGIEATRRIHREWPDVVIVGLSVQEDDATARSVMEAGATRFMSKASSAGEIMALMGEVLAKS